MLEARSVHRRPVWAALTTPVGLIAVLGVVFVVSTLAGSVAVRNAGVSLLIYSVIVIGLYTFAGPSGIMSFGHASFMAVGAYTAALLTLAATSKSRLTGLPDFLRENQFTLETAVLAGAVVAALLALIAGTVLMRLSGLASGIATLALLVVVHVVIAQSGAITAGPGSLVGVPVWTTPGVAWACAAVAVVVAFVFQQSSAGLKLKASREDQLVARASGVRIYRLRLLAFVLSALIVGAGGALFALKISVLSPGAVYLDVTFMMIAMLVVGGMRSLTGAVVGVVVVSVVGELVRQFESGIEIAGIAVPAIPGLSQVAIALLLLISLVLRPKGLTGGRELHEIVGRVMGARKKRSVSDG